MIFKQSLISIFTSKETKKRKNYLIISYLFILRLGNITTHLRIHVEADSALG